MGQLEGFAMESGDDDIVDTNTSHKTKWGAIKLTLPRRLIFTLIVLFIFEVRYYVMNCDRVDGMWVSKPLYLPTSATFNFVSFLNGHVPAETVPVWVMSKTDL